jgi:hypothetical protein
VKSRWREYLKGEYVAKDGDKMNWEIRQRAKQIMKDLLLITEKMSQRQRTLIFKTPETRNNLVIPLIRELHNNASIWSPDQEKIDAIQELARNLESCKIPYDWTKLVEDEGYRSRKDVQYKTFLETGQKVKLRSNP